MASEHRVSSLDSETRRCITCPTNNYAPPARLIRMAYRLIRHAIKSRTPASLPKHASRDTAARRILLSICGSSFERSKIANVLRKERSASRVLREQHCLVNCNVVDPEARQRGIARRGSFGTRSWKLATPSIKLNDVEWKKDKSSAGGTGQFNLREDRGTSSNVPSAVPCRF